MFNFLSMCQRAARTILRAHQHGGEFMLINILTSIWCRQVFFRHINTVGMRDSLQGIMGFIHETGAVLYDLAYVYIVMVSV